MKRVTEIKFKNESRFTIEEIISGEIISSNFIQIQTAQAIFNQKQYYLLYDNEMQVISNVYRFLNHNLKNKSENTIIKSMYALRYLYIFGFIIGNSIESFKFNDYVKLNYFLKGVSGKGQELELELKTKRGNSSINGFFSVYREYYRFLGLTSSEIFIEQSFSKYIPIGTSNIKITGNPYTSPSRKSIEVPKYISVDEFKIIIKYIRENIKNKEERMMIESIIRIMYEGGLRLGEVLGSTLEDYLIQTVGSGDNEREICYVYIRNRVSDKNFQKAKTCMNITNKSDYRKSEYKMKNVGYQLSFLSIDTYDLICDYIDLAHDRAYKKCRKNYYKSKADAVGEYKKKCEDNYYLFINKRGTPLSDVTWNKKLRIIFEAVGIQIDYGVKCDNLSHRFRHGFIMNLIHNLKIPREKVMVRSRHKSYSSLDKYYNPTLEQIILMKTEIEDSLLDLSDI